MKITCIRIHTSDLPCIGGAYVCGSGNVITSAKASVVVIDTDAGLQGCAEFTPGGDNYMIADCEGVEAFARLAASSLLGEDPRQVAQGQGYAKAPFEAAWWDILGQACDQPVWMLLEGKLTDGAPMYRVAPQKATEETLAEMARYRSDGCREFRIKVGGEWQADIDPIKAGVSLLSPGEKAMADANQDWRVDNAICVARATADPDLVLEQPCRTYEECCQVRRVAQQPTKLDKCGTGMSAAQHIGADRGAETCCLKLSNPGGSSKARLVRDCFVENRIPVVRDDTWGGEITTAVVAHFAASTPAEYRQNTTDLMNYTNRSTGVGGAWASNGNLYAPDTPGLGVTPDFGSLGAPMAEYAA